MKRRNCFGINNGFYCKHHSEKTKKHISEMTKGKNMGSANGSSRPEVREKISKGMKAFIRKHPGFIRYGKDNPATHEDIRIKIGIATTKRASDPKYRKRINELIKIGMSKPEVRQKIEQAWNRPGRREECRRARANQVLPVKDSKPELIMQELLTQLIKEGSINEVFYTHRYIPELQLPAPVYLHQFDIVFYGLKLIIEVDGIAWHHNPKYFPEHIERDSLINEHIQQNTDWTILRFKDEPDILENLEEVRLMVLNTIQELHL